MLASMAEACYLFRQSADLATARSYQQGSFSPLLTYAYIQITQCTLGSWCHRRLGHVFCVEQLEVGTISLLQEPP